MSQPRTAQPAACPIACGNASCSWPAPPMPASTTITSAKNFATSKVSRALARPFAICCARPGSARTVNVKLPLIASVASRALVKARCCCWTAACTGGCKIAARSLTLLGFLDDATRKVLVAEFFPTEDARGYFRLLHRLFPPLRRPRQFLWRPSQRLRSQR